MNGPAFDLLAAELEAARDEHLRELNRMLFADEAMWRVPVKPLTLRERLRFKWLRVRGYFSTLWRAIKGDDPYDVESCW